MDTAPWPSEEFCTHIYRGPKRKEWHWSTTHQWWHFHVLFHRECHTACGGDWQILSLVHGQSWQWTFSPTWCKWGQNVCVSLNNNANGTLLTRPNDRLLGISGPVLHSILQQHDEMKQIFTHAFVHFMDNRNGVDKMGENFNRLC